MTKCPAFIPPAESYVIRQILEIDVGDTPFVQPHSFDFFEVTYLVHGSRSTVAMANEPATDLAYVVE